MRKKNSQAGFTLIELMAALLIAVNIMMAAGTALTWSFRHFQLISTRRQGQDQALMALRMMERQMASVACVSDATCGASSATVLSVPNSNTLVGRSESIGGASTFFRFEYSATSPGTIRFCNPVDLVTACGVSGLDIARNIMNSATATPMFTLANGITVRARVVVREGTEGSTSLNKTYQSAFTVPYSIP